MMVTRVSLLLLVTGLFAGMWSADSPDERTATAKQLARRSSSPRVFADHNRTMKNTRGSNLLAGHRQAAPIPLPQGIAPGLYLVVDQAGTTQCLSVTTPGRTPSHAPNLVAVDQYTVRDGEARWHFIRLEQSATPRLAREILEVRAAGLH